MSAPILSMPPHGPPVELRKAALGGPGGLPEVVLRPEWQQWFQRVRGLAIGQWTTATRPTVELYQGRMGFNSTSGAVDVWTGSAWISLEADALAFLPLAGGTMAGAIAMGGSKVTGAGAATANGDLVRYEQVVGLFQADLLHVREEQTSGTDGGTFTTGAWRTRTLNTSKTNEISGASLGSNQITLPAGTYYIEARAPALAVGLHKAKLRNVTDGVDVLIGSNTNTSPSDSVTSDSVVEGRFTLAGSKALELQHYCSATKATNGFGASCAFSVVEVYSEVRIWTVA